MRLSFGFIVALFINLGLFTLMHLMTSSDHIERNLLTDIQILDFVRVKKDTTIETKQRQVPEKPKPPEKMPPPPKRVTPKQKVSSPMPKMNVPNIKVPLNITGGPYLGDFSAAPTTPTTGLISVAEFAQVVPLVRIPPRYPRTAARRGIEGVVKLAFTISKQGRVLNPYVLSSNPAGVFDKAAIRAIIKWKFNPKIVDGKPIEQTAAQEITFRLSNQ